MTNARKADHPASQFFLDRWSPRAYTGEPMPDAVLHRLFEAARWAPSASNLQPWLFLYAKRDTPDFEKFLGLLNETNQVWAKNAAVLIVLVSKKTRRNADGFDMPLRTHSLDAGAAWAYLALEASILGWPAHAMAGIAYDHAARVLNVPDDWSVEAAIALGRRGDPASLPEKLQAIEQPNARKPISEITAAGAFPGA